MNSRAKVERCLVLGGRGFIGSHVTDALLRQGMVVRCFDRSGPSPAVRPASGGSIEFVQGDFTNPVDVERAVDGCTTCIHLVSTTLPKSSNLAPAYDVESNLVGTIHLLELAVRRGLRKVVFVSSGGTVYGIPRSIPIVETDPTEPISSYGITKLAIEKYLHLFHVMHGLDYSILRLSNPYGEGQRLNASQGAVAVFMGKVLDGEPIEIWGDGSTVRDYVYVRDVAGAVLAAVHHSPVDRVFNIGAGVGHSLNDLIEAIERATGRTALRHYLPARNFDVPVNVLSITRAREQLGWSPTVAFDKGIELLADWIDRQSARPHTP